MKNLNLILFFSFITTIAAFPLTKNRQEAKTSHEGIKKVKDIIIYEDALYYSSFPSVAKIGDNDFIVAFRRAPDRRIFHENGNGHVDPNSYLMMVRSTDGDVWTETAQLMFAHPLGGSQDPCLIKLRDGTLLCTSYVWSFIRSDGISKLKKPFVDVGGGAVFQGGYIIRSTDKGKTWLDPVSPPHVEEEIYLNGLGKPLPAYNRGALHEGGNGRIYWVVAVNDSIPKKKTSNHLLTSDDKGISWSYAGVVASDAIASFNEASIYQTPKGDLVAFLRTADMNDEACIARSVDGGKTFTWEKIGFQGHPLNALRLPDNRVLLTYGYRHPPYGIRARVLNEECTDFKIAAEIILRDDGDNADLGYTWPVMLDDKSVLVVYYFNKKNGTRYIAGTILKLSETRDVKQ